jgi:hypothetical protein
MMHPPYFFMRGFFGDLVLHFAISWHGGTSMSNYIYK